MAASWLATPAWSRSMKAVAPTASPVAAVFGTPSLPRHKFVRASLWADLQNL